MRQNKDRFKGPVYEPARLNVFAKTQDRRIVDLVEGPIALNAFKVSVCRFEPREQKLILLPSTQTFLFEYQEDYDLMMREVNDTKLARINGAQIGVGKTLADHPNWMTPEQVRLVFVLRIGRPQR
jgi:structural maintenance of chromosomes protein 5